MKSNIQAILIGVLAILAFLYLRNFFPIVEHAAGSPGALVQLATSSTSTLPIGFTTSPDYEDDYSNDDSDDEYENFGSNANFMNILPWILITFVVCKYLL